VNRAGFSWWEAWGPVAHLGFQKGGESLPSNYGVLKIEGLGGRPPVSGRPGAQGSPAPPKSGPAREYTQDENAN